MLMVGAAASFVAEWPLKIGKVFQNKRAKTITKSSYTIPLVVLVSFFVLSFGINGPAYLSDEVGYLDKAATIAGGTVHLSTSWFAGYSFMISPAFFLSQNPYVEWYIVMFLNALMWAGSAALLRYILRNMFPKRSDQAIFFATLGAMLYPSWLAMSGYAFSTSGFVLVFMAALAAIIKSDLTDTDWLYAAGVCAAYLCWIHPIGVLFLGLFIVAMVIQGVLKHNVRFIAVSFSSVLLGVAYLLLVHPLFNRLMSGSLANDNHYSQSLTAILSSVSSLHYWLQFSLSTLGLAFFAVVASFGLVIYGSVSVVRELLRNKQTWKKALQDSRAIVAFLAILSVIGIIVLTSLSSASARQLRLDQWIYGRYTDMYLLPLLGFGLLASWRLKQALWAAGFVFLVGFALSALTNTQNTQMVLLDTNIQGLWPIQIASLAHVAHYWAWGAVGALGILMAGIIGDRQYRVLLPVLLLPITAIMMVSNYSNHVAKIHQHSSVTSLYAYLKDNYSATDCIGFTPQTDQHEQFNLYSYYLHGYDIKKMSLDQWQQQSCQGPYLTYDTSAAHADGLKIIGVDAATGLHIITHENKVVTSQGSQNNLIIFTSKALTVASSRIN